MKINELTNNKLPEIVIMIGLPGSGKSTLIKRKYPNHVIVSSDDIIEDFAAKDGKTYDEVFSKYIGAATGIMKNNFDAAIKSNMDIVWDQTNLSEKKRRGILSKVPNHYKKVAVVFNIPDKLRYERMGFRKGKSIPPDVIKSMEKSFQYPNKGEGFDEIIEIKN